MPHQELFEYFKTTNSYTSARERSRRSRRRKRARAAVKQRSKPKKGRGLDGLKPVSAEGPLVIPPWFGAAALATVAVSLLLGSYYLGRSHGVALESRGPVNPEAANAAERNGTEKTDPKPGAAEDDGETTRESYSILIRSLEDNQHNEKLALDIQVNLDALGYPQAQAVFDRELDKIRVYVGRSPDSANRDLRAWLAKVRETFPDAKIVRRGSS